MMIKPHICYITSICQVLWLLILAFIPGECASLNQAMSQSGSMQEILTSQAAITVAVTSLVIIIVMVIVLLGCADLCRKQQGFQDFANDDVFSPEIIETQPSGQFTMLPPVENTPESYSAGAVMFEPLPDIATAHQVEPQAMNRAMMRPRVSSVGPPVGEFGQGDAIAIRSDPIQEKLKLQKIVSSSQLQLPRNQLHFIKELGSGWFGQVLQGDGSNILPGHKKTKVVIQRLKEDADHIDQLVFLQEATPYREVNHTNVVRVLGQCTEVTPFLLVLELCPFGDVKTYLRSHKVAVESFNEKGLLLKFACDMAAGLIELHSNNFVHHDFATRNCLLGSDLTVKVGDYGLGENTYPEDYYKDVNGDGIPIRWMAPECMDFTSDDKLLVTKFTKEANIWSYGVALWEILQFGQLPYSDLTNEHVLRLVVKEKSVKLPKPDMPISFLGRIFQLIQLCLSDPEQRPSLRQVRILLLHLLASKGSSRSSLFEQKWNQLMPKKPAQIIRVGDTTPSTTSISTHSPRTPAAGMAAGGNTITSPSRPTPQVPNSDPLSQKIPVSLSLQDELAAANTTKPKKAGTPVNELDLQSELAAVSMPSPVKPVKDDDIVEDMEIGKAIPYSEPTSPVETNVKDPLMDFITSTPKKPTDDASVASDTGVLSVEQETGNSEYVTALSSMGGERSSSVQNLLEEPSESTKTFASFLQTVSTSVDLGDDSESAASSFKSNYNDVSMDMEQVFETLAETPKGTDNPGFNQNETTSSVTEQTLVEKYSEKTEVHAEMHTEEHRETHTEEHKETHTSTAEVKEITDAIDDAVMSEITTSSNVESDKLKVETKQKEDEKPS